MVKGLGPFCLVLVQRDLRLQDQPAFYHGAKAAYPIYVVYVPPQRQGRARSWWAAESVKLFGQMLAAQGISFQVFDQNLDRLLPTLFPGRVCAGIYHTGLDCGLGPQQIQGQEVPIYSFADNFLLAPGEGKLYKVFTPFWKAACQQVFATPFPFPDFQPHHRSLQGDHEVRQASWQPDLGGVPWWESLQQAWQGQIGEAAACARWSWFIHNRLEAYHERRNRPDVDNTSRLSASLQLGEIGVRQMWADLQALPAGPGRTTFQNELGWREFARHLLCHYPDLATRPLRPHFEGLWRGGVPDQWIKAWQEGRTGYPLVDAGMRQLWQTGWMHNRVRMVAASLAVKNLGISWQQGEEWFFDTLIDADEATNGASWQWVAGCGTDSSPFFRIFNPTLQAQTHDPDLTYIKTWVPELARLDPQDFDRPWQSCPDYPRPIVDFAATRAKALSAYAALPKTMDKGAIK